MGRYSTVGTANARGSAFTYGPDHMRAMHLEFDSFSGGSASGTPLHYTKKKLYVSSGGMEVDYTNGASSGSAVWGLGTVRIYIPAPGGNAGSAELAPNATSASAHKYLVYHYDHLGSIQAVTNWGDSSQNFNYLYANDATNKESVYSYDAWGQRRDTKDWSGYAWNGSLIAPVFTWCWDDPATSANEDDLIPRGFTGHEMLDALGLVHMNGRIYDPRLGRFLSADQIVQAPQNLQSYNRYSYCFNNPLGLVDPSGYESEEAQREREERERKERINREVLGTSVRDVIVGDSGGSSGQQAAGTVTAAAGDQASPKAQDAQVTDAAANDLQQEASSTSSEAPTTEANVEAGADTDGGEADTDIQIFDQFIEDEGSHGRTVSALFADHFLYGDGSPIISDPDSAVSMMVASQAGEAIADLIMTEIVPSMAAGGDGTYTMNNVSLGRIGLYSIFPETDIGNAIGGGHFTVLEGRISIITTVCINQFVCRSVSFSGLIKQSDYYSFMPTGVMGYRLLDARYSAGHSLEMRAIGKPFYNSQTFNLHFDR